MKLIQQTTPLVILSLLSFWCYGQKLEYFSNHDDINQLFIEENRIWVATNGGLLELDLDANLIKKHTALNGINAPKIEQVFRDEEGLLFIETNAYKNAIQIYKEGRWENYSGFQENEHISLITSNGLFGYLHSSESDVYLKSNKEWKTYKTDFDRYHLNNAMVLDDNSNLWISYKSGVIKHDGKNSKVYQFLPKYRDPSVLLKDKNGVLWALDIWNSWYRYDKKKDTWVICKSKACNLISKRRFSFSDSKENLWFFNTKADSLYKYDGTQWKGIPVPVKDVPKSIDNEDGKDWLFTGAEDRAGNLWFGSTYGNLYRYNGKTWKIFNISAKEYLIQDKSLQNISSIIEDKDENLWITGNDFITYHNVVENKNDFFDRDDFEGDFRFAYVATSSIVEGNKGALYVNPQEGIFKYYKEQKTWKYMLEEQDISFMHYDKQEKKMSFLNDNGQLITIDSGGYYSNNMILEDKSNRGHIMYRATLFDSQGGLWVSANKELYYSNKKRTLMTFNSKNSPIDTDPEVIYEDSKGKIWVNIREGVAYWDGTKWTTFTNKNTLLESVNVNRTSKCLPIAEDENGNVFVRSDNSIFKWDGNKWIGQRQWNDCLTDSYSGSLFFDSNNAMWILNNKKSIFKCDGVDCVSIIDNYDAKYIDVIEDSKGRIWILTQFGGIFRYTKKQ